MARILISGASGFIGRPLVQFLSSKGHVIVQLIRSNEPPSQGAVFWNPEKKEAREEDFEDFAAVIHLAGEPLTLSRWSRAKREKILQSRVQGTAFLSHLLARAKNPCKCFISASAIGYYGDRKEDLLDEKEGPGKGFLSQVCAAWEEASGEIEKRGARTVHTRFGIVLGAKGGALRQMLIPYKLGLGGRVGSGMQWMSWIHRDDLIRGIDHILRTESLQGALNLVSPNPVRQEEFSTTLAQLLHRPHFLKIPPFTLRIRYGQIADELFLASIRASCSKLLASNFSFQYPDLRGALYEALQI